MELRECLVDIADMAEDATTELQSVANDLRHASAARHPTESIVTALTRIEHLIARVDATLSGTVGSAAPPDVSEPVLRALIMAHNEIERLQELINPQKPNFTLRYIRRLFAQL